MDLKVIEQVNDTLDVIYRRRAVRSYLPTMPDDELILQIIKAGCMAPSAMDQQPWRFYISTHRDAINEFSKAILKAARTDLIKSSLSRPFRTVKNIGKLGKFRFKGPDPIFHGAPIIIFITAPADSEWGDLDVGMCAQNIMLAAKSLDLDSCPIGMARYLSSTPAYSRLDIPVSESIVLAIALGYGAEEPQVPEREFDKVLFVDRMECC